MKINSNNILTKEQYFPQKEFDFLSIDIDGQDFHVWNNLDVKYNPRVVSIEINYHISPLKDKVMPLNDNWIWKGNEMSGASVLAVKKLGNKKNYSLVATCMSDAIFVRNDLLYDINGICLFKNINNEVELVKLNVDIANENLKYNFKDDHFDYNFFSSSDVFI